MFGGMEKKGDGEENIDVGEKFSCKESRKMEGAMCDRREVALGGRSSSIKEVVSYTEYLDICVTPGSNLQHSNKVWPDETGAEERNINYFTCLVSTVDIRGALLKSDV